MTETMAHGYSSERSQRELSNENQHGRVEIVFKILNVLVLWTNVASALEGLRGVCQTWASVSATAITERGHFEST